MPNFAQHLLCELRTSRLNFVSQTSNQILTLNNNVGSTERVQGGYVSSVLDDDSSGTALEISNDMTRVEVLDYTQSSHINFEAEIRFREAPGVTQVETFGISLNAEGTCFYGMQLEAVQNRIKDNISLDHLSRVLVDVQQDSSSIVDSVMSRYQRDLLDLVFVGDSVNRNKISLVIANEITPHLTSGEYMSSPEYQNEFSQIVGDVKAAYDISEQVSLIFGSQVIDRDRELLFDGNSWTPRSSLSTSTTRRDCSFADQLHETTSRCCAHTFSSNPLICSCRICSREFGSSTTTSAIRPR